VSEERWPKAAVGHPLRRPLLCTCTVPCEGRGLCSQVYIWAAGAAAGLRGGSGTAELNSYQYISAFSTVDGANTRVLVYQDVYMLVESWP
jgi:hypothetical protein